MVYWRPVWWLEKELLVIMVRQVLHLDCPQGVVPGGEGDGVDNSALVSRSRRFLGRR